MARDLVVIPRDADPSTFILALGGFLVEPENAGHLVCFERVAATQAEEGQIRIVTMALPDREENEGFDDLAHLWSEDDGSLALAFTQGDGLAGSAVAVDVADAKRGDLDETGPGVVEEGESEALPFRYHEPG